MSNCLPFPSPQKRDNDPSSHPHFVCLTQLGEKFIRTEPVLFIDADQPSGTWSAQDSVPTWFVQHNMFVRDCTTLLEEASRSGLRPYNPNFIMQRACYQLCHTGRAVSNGNAAAPLPKSRSQAATAWGKCCCERKWFLRWTKPVKYKIFLNLSRTSALCTINIENNRVKGNCFFFFCFQVAGR